MQVVQKIVMINKRQQRHSKIKLDHLISTEGLFKTAIRICCQATRAQNPAKINAARPSIYSTIKTVSRHMGATLLR